MQPRKRGNGVSIVRKKQIKHINIWDHVGFVEKTSSVGIIAAWDARDIQRDRHPRLSLRFVHENTSTVMIPVLLIQEQQLSKCTPSTD